MPVRTHRHQLSDPFAHVLQPPENETPAERQARVEREQEEKRVSDQIDEELRKERGELKKRAKKEARVLLLGQSESGKSTVLKNFRLAYAPAQFKAELLAWRAVVQLNLMQNVITILDILEDRLSSDPSTSLASTGSSTHPHPPPPPPPRPTQSTARASIDSTAPERLESAAAAVTLTQKHRILTLRLSPLRKVEEDVRRRLGADDPEWAFDTSGGALPGALPTAFDTRKREFGVRGWIGALGLGLGSGGGSGSGKKGPAAEGEATVDETTGVLASLRDDIVELWADADIQQLLRARKISMEDHPGFFLADTARIAVRDYVPSNNDVVRARLRTLGVQEWRITLETTSDSFGAEWVIYDVGGSRSMRHAWLPYFDFMNAIIFLAPISCFDERLAEDPSVNRLEDSLLLWHAIISSKLLGETTLIVFLNKCDLLKRKLQNGVRVNKYMISFGSRENEVGAVVKYLKDKFKDMARSQSAVSRPIYLHATSVTDTKATAVTLSVVRDGIVRDHLKNAELV
ncbi:unnamed protein product [Mycena citricolor]|uniref:G-alpha-domain-containing protein n=1 Tax=Mycena citricolor TaxID=2018698 RepID=A0AAD2Q343_9AGAR|nr:unnamed protein product [Mycena citricolor]